MRVIFCLFSLVFFNLQAQIYKKDDKIVHAKNNIPIELKLLLASYQKADISNDNFLSLLRHVYNIDSYIKYVSQEEFYFIVKSEIYKTILKNLPPTHQIFEVSNLANFKKATEKSKDPFIIWLLNSFYTDAEELISNKAYKTYLAEKLSGEITSPASKKINKKIQLISRFYSKISIDFPDSIRTDLLRSYEECLINIEASLFIMINESKFEKFSGFPSIGDPLNYFSIDNIKKIAAPSKLNAEKTIEEILDETPETLNEEAQVSKPNDLNKLPSPSKEDWLNEDTNSPINLKNAPKPDDDAEWLQDF